MKHQAEEREEQRLAEQRAANDAKLAAKDAIIADLQQRLKEHEQVISRLECLLHHSKAARALVLHLPAALALSLYVGMYVCM